MKSLIPILAIVLLHYTCDAQEKDKNKSLKEVTVTAKMPVIKHKVDRIIVNVDGMITAAGSNALEVLSKSPGVFIDLDGNIQLNGKGGVLVLIDDKPTYMSVLDLAAYLRSLPAGMIDKIELISNPPARYDASGGAVINIQLKKNKTPGWNGNISLGYNQGVYARRNNSLNLNYRKKKINVFGNIGYSRDAGYTGETSQRNYQASSTTLLNRNYSYASDAINLRAGIDYYVSAKTTLGILLTGGIRPKSDVLHYNSDQLNTDQKLDSTATGNTTGDYQWYSGGVNLNVLHRLNDKGSSITGDLDYVNLQADGSQYLSTNVYQLDGNLSSANDLLYRLPATINIWSAKSDYNLPLKGDATIEAGYKSSWVSTNYQNNWFQKTGSAYTQDYSRSDHFIYTENINALYASASKEWKHWALKSGLRMENTRMYGQQPGNIVIDDSSFKRNYTNFFPSFYFSWKPDSAAHHVFTISYGSRIRRPGYQQLNPFLFYNDRYTYSAGDPGLRPQYMYAIELKYDYKNILGVDLFYLKVNQLIQSIIQPVGDVFVSRPENFGINYSFNCLSWLSVDVVKDWHLNASLMLFHLVNKGTTDDQVVNNHINSGELEISNQFRLSKKWSAELTGIYATSHLSGQTKTNPFCHVSAGILKMMLKEKGTLKLSFNDLFHSMIRREHVTTATMLARRRVETDTRRIGLAFSYRFGKDTNNQKRNHNTGGAAEEQGRLN